MVLKLDDIRNTLICSIIIMNIYGTYLSNMLNIQSFLFTAIPEILLFLCSLGSSVFFNFKIYTMFFVSCLIMLIHILLGGYILEEIKYLLYIFVFLIIVSVYNKKTWAMVLKTICLISFFMTLDAFIAAPQVLKEGLGFRNIIHYTILDKAYYTFILSFSSVYLMHNIFFDDYKYCIKKLLNIGFLLGNIIVNLVMMQSKIYLITLIVCFLTNYSFLDYKAKKIIKKYLVFLIIIFIILFIHNPLMLPDFIYIMLHRFFGLFNTLIEQIEYFERLSSTYVSRTMIYEYAFSLFRDNPFFGIGFGKYSEYVKHIPYITATQAESSMLSMLLEGGLFYFINHYIYLTTELFSVHRIAKSNPVNKDIILVETILITCFLINIFNDYYSSIYWILLALIFRHKSIV